MVIPEFQAQREPEDYMESQERPERRACREEMVKMACRALMDYLVKLAILGLPDRLAYRDIED